MNVTLNLLQKPLSYGGVPSSPLTQVPYARPAPLTHLLLAVLKAPRL